MKKVKVEDAVGLPLLHDVTEIDLDRNFKGIAFKKGHIITESDIEKLRKIGKRYVYVWEDGDEDLIHEDEFALKLASLIAGENVYYDKYPKEGKINFYSTIKGVLVLNREKIIKLNMLKIPALTTIHNFFPVDKDKLIASFRIIPLFAKRDIFEKSREILDFPPIKVESFKIKKASIIVTGNEVYEGIIEDKFIPILSEKLNFYDIEVVDKVILPDDEDRIKAKLLEFISKSELILITGGTSVDQDDVTKVAIREAGVDIIQEGCPIQPGNNLTIGYFNDNPVIAIPAAAIFYKFTSFDIFLPRIIAKIKISANDIAEASIGGLCHFCKKCHYPVCPFGKS